ncbi:hypothetical protein [Mycolicibacterium porcinum]|uniref:DUF4190 domain-containing protein n=1 Tax=Mycolicibacterium porcinum TaxID=39693 RepID=A0ABV3VLY7_9MYCO
MERVKGEQKFWTWLILGLLGFFIGVPFVLTMLGNLTKKANKYSSGVDFDLSKILGVLIILGVIALVLWFLFAVLGGSSRGGSGQRDLANAQRDMSRAVEAVRAHHAQRMHTMRAGHPQRVQNLRDALRKTRCEENGAWLSGYEAKEELTHA